MKRLLRKLVLLTLSAGLAACCFAACGELENKLPPPPLEEDLKLATPSNVQLFVDVVRWDSVEHATEYIVQVGQTTETVSVEYFDVSSWILTGAYDIRVMAKAEGYENSKWSEPVKLVIGTKGLEFTLTKDESGYEVSRGAANVNNTHVYIPSFYNDLPVVSVAKEAFYQCTRLTGVTLPDSVSNIGKYAFNTCSRLAEVNIPEAVTKLTVALFRECTSLKNIKLPSGLRELENTVFYGCTALAEIDIPETVEKIGVSTFEGTPWLEAQSHETVYINKILYKYKAPSETEEFYIDDIREDTVYISGSAVVGLRNLVGIKIPDSVKSIGYNAFGSCGLKEVVLPESIIELEQGIFTRCKSLERVVIPKSLQELPRYTFSQCPSVKEIVYTGTMEEWKKIEPVGSWDGTFPDDYIITCSDGTIYNNKNAKEV